ncbi:MAG: response regulator transcription factor [Chloroflexi bacterium]|nr:response regulator transcription factor [Chloroflexota bacterium]
MVSKILIVDDDVAITANMAAFLERTGFAVDVAANGKEGLRKINSFAPDLVILDVIMPHLNGREVLRQLRHAGNWLPVILLTQVGDSTERAMALEEGADDYLNKPFDPQELVARIRSVLRRSMPNRPPLGAAQRLASGDIILERSPRRVLLDGKDIPLTPKAIALLDYLMTHPEELITRERLLEAVWGWADPVGARTVDTRIAELRKGLNDSPDQHRYIETVPGAGYRFVGKVEPLG